MTNFLQAVKNRVVVYDGAMGTNIQFRNPSVDDFWGKEGCNELLVLSRPDIIKDIHADFFKVGCDVVETDTFGATSVVLAEYDLQDKVAEIQHRSRENCKRSCTTVFDEGQASFRRRLNGANDEAALARAHHIRRDGKILRRAGPRVDRGRRRCVAD
jgi:5-methyltetrahydrofolate--homocysteine methyltransferase